MPKLESYLTENAERFEKELCQWLKIPSVSADSRYVDEVRRSAKWLVDQFDRLGFSSDLIATEGHPLVYAERLEAPDAPTVLVYGHYDVQPVDPLDAWTTPPFEPTIRDGKLFARGASDDKGQLFTHLKGVEALLQTEGHLPVNIKFLIEGEEESEGNAIDEYLEENGDDLACDCLVVSDSSQFGPGQPAITCGLRGIIYGELTLEGPNRDLHSGAFGGTLTNPAIALCEMLATLRDEKRRITIPGFYDDVETLSEKENRQLDELPFDETHYAEELGVSVLDGETGYTTLGRRWVRPTFDICGLTAGYQGEGNKTIIPARASAKISFRLVPNQDPQKIIAALSDQLQAICPPGIRMTFSAGVGSPGMRVSPESPWIEAAAEAIRRAFDVRPVFMREGGSIPIVAQLSEKLKAAPLLLGWGQDDDNIHSPNEKFSLADFHRAIRASAYLWHELAKVKA